MKILLVNPNISQSVTDLIREEAMRVALPDTEITTATADFGVAYIETPAEAAVGGYAALKMLAEHHPGHQAAVVAAFGDPGVEAAKEILPIPVIGLTEAALSAALLLGGRFAIVGISARIGAWYRQTVERLGLGSRFVGYRGLRGSFADVGSVQRDEKQLLLELCIACVEQDGADAVVLAGAPLAGLARQITDRVPVPLIDGVGSAVRMAEALGRSGFAPRRSGALAPPPAKGHAGLPEPLAALIGRTR
ncbi:MAG TPA: aspartate/glutamate racemase family protein [Burkholderiaceae bacterium]|nr:aspartate/glutamate racemase family protein [Burkholderiaceae bacterium]